MTQTLRKTPLALASLCLLVLSSVFIFAPSAYAASFQAKCETYVEDEENGNKYKVSTKTTGGSQFTYTTSKKCSDMGLTGSWKTLSETEYQALLNQVSPPHDTGSTASSTAESPASCPPNAFLTFPTWYRGLQCYSGTATGSEHVAISQSKDGMATFIWTIVLNCLEILLQTAGILAVVFLMYNGFQYLTSAGSADKISKAKTGMLQSIVGLAIAVSASAIIGLIVGRISFS